MKAWFSPIIAIGIVALGDAAELSDKQMTDLVNGILHRIYAGDVKALDDFKALPNDVSFPFLILQIRQNQDVDRPLSQSIVKRSAEVVKAAPGYEEYFANLFRATNRNRNRQDAIFALPLVDRKVAIRLFGEALTDPKVPLPAAGDIVRALDGMNIEGAPYSRKGAPSVRQPIEKWKAWWEKNKDKYTR